MTWTPAHLPDQTGRTFVITGGNAGLGYFTAEQLARTGAHVVLASRNGGRADVAAQSIRGQVPTASVDTLALDLTSPASVRAAGSRLADFERLDGLILNAGTTSGSGPRHELPWALRPHSPCLAGAASAAGEPRCRPRKPCDDHRATRRRRPAERSEV